MKELELLRLRRHPASTKQPWRPGEGYVPARRVTGHLQRARHAAFDGAGVVEARLPCRCRAGPAGVDGW